MSVAVLLEIQVKPETLDEMKAFRKRIFLIHALMTGARVSIYMAT